MNKKTDENRVTQTSETARSTDRTTLVVEQGTDRTTLTSQSKDDSARTTVVKPSIYRNPLTNRYEKIPERTTNPVESTNDLRTKVDVGDIIEGYVVGRLLTDSSGEADIHLCEKDGQTYVIKVYKTSYQMNAEVQAQIQAVNSPYVLKSLASGYYKTRHFEIIPYFINGTLFDHLAMLSDEFIKTTVVYEVNEGLKAIHDHGIVHNDIKPHNIFLTNDKKHIVLGDFGISVNLAGRTYVTKVGMALTHMYAAPEADESSSKKTDYFSFGMTLLHLGFKEDPFKGFNNHKVRMLLLNYSQNIPEKVDSQLADLIAKLIRFSPSERLDYEGVKRWLDNADIYRGARLTNAFQTVALTEPYNFRKVRYDNLIELTEAMVADWEWALKNIENGFVETILRREVDLLAEVKSHQEELTADEYLFYVLSFLNPNVSFQYQGYNFGNFEGYIAYLRTHYDANATLLGTRDLVKIEMKATRVAEATQAIVERIWDAPISDLTKVDLLINFFTDTPKVYSAGVIYDTLSVFAEKAFDDAMGINPTHRELLKTGLFYELLDKKYSIPQEPLVKKLKTVMETSEKVITKFKKEKSDALRDFLLLAFFSKTVLGYVPINYQTHALKTIDDFVLWAKHDYEKRVPLVPLGQFIKDGFLSLYVILYEDMSDKEKTAIGQIAAYSEDPETVGRYFYLMTCEHAVYHVDGTVTFSQINDVFVYLNAAKNFALALSKLQKQDLFFKWMEIKGYHAPLGGAQS